MKRDLLFFGGALVMAIGLGLVNPWLALVPLGAVAMTIAVLMGGGDGATR